MVRRGCLRMTSANTIDVANRIAGSPIPLPAGFSVAGARLAVAMAVFSMFSYIASAVFAYREIGGVNISFKSSSAEAPAQV